MIVWVLNVVFVMLSASGVTSGDNRQERKGETLHVWTYIFLGLTAWVCASICLYHHHDMTVFTEQDKM